MSVLVWDVITNVLSLSMKLKCQLKKPSTTLPVKTSTLFTVYGTKQTQRVVSPRGCYSRVNYGIRDEMLGLINGEKWLDPRDFDMSENPEQYLQRIIELALKCLHTEEAKR